MELQLATIELRRAGRNQGHARAWLQEYATRIRRFCRFEHAVFPSEAELLQSCARTQARRPPLLVLLDSRGKAMASEALAAWLDTQQSTGAQRIVFAIGPADGWSPQARAQASLLLSLGPMTLAHELAAVVVAEQIYRGFTILKGLPYHLGHGGSHSAGSD
jgi:23S rRNA (pseudouridine1915-N3)-methyltransferase